MIYDQEMLRSDAFRDPLSATNLVLLNEHVHIEGIGLVDSEVPSLFNNVWGLWTLDHGLEDRIEIGVIWKDRGYD